MAADRILFMGDDGYGVQTVRGAVDVAGGFIGYRPYWQPGGLPGGGVDRRFWTAWERVDGSPEIWPAVVDDFGSLRTGRMVRQLAQERDRPLPAPGVTVLHGCTYPNCAGEPQDDGKGCCACPTGGVKEVDRG